MNNPIVTVDVLGGVAETQAFNGCPIIFHIDWDETTDGDYEKTILYLKDKITELEIIPSNNCSGWNKYKNRTLNELGEKLAEMEDEWEEMKMQDEGEKEA